MSTNRKPVHLEFDGGKSPRQRIWEKIRELKKFQINELVQALPGTIHRDTTRTYVKSLVAAGYLFHQPNHPYEYVEYKLQKDNGVEAPRVRLDGSPVEIGRKQENLWRTLRTLNHTVGHAELAALASTEAHPVAPTFARDYLVNLFKAGYLTRIDGKFVLLPNKNTGPRPPMVQRIKQVYDPNLGAVVWTDSHGDDDA